MQNLRNLNIEKTEELKILHLENYDGPLDLLLDLVKDKKVDVFEVNLVELANAYLDVMLEMMELDLDLASEYLVMAAQLINLKAKLILADPEQQIQAEQEPGGLLARLAEYQQFKNASVELRKMEQEGQYYLSKIPSDIKDFQREMDETILTGSSTPVKLITTLRHMFERSYAQQMRQTKIEAFNLSPAERRVELLEIMANTPNLSFEDFFSVKTMNHFVVTMLTTLDMARKQELILEQKEQFGNIRIMKGESYGQ